MKWAVAVFGGLSTLLRRPVPASATSSLIGVLLVLGNLACDASPSAPDAPNIPAIPRIDLGSGPSVTPMPSPTTAITPTASPIPTVTVTPVPVAPSAGSGEVIQVPRLVLAEVPEDIPAYSRDDWKHWVDTDGDCQNSRAEVLIEESSTPPTFNTDRDCRVIGGNWDGPYTGEAFDIASDVDIDHLVPLKNAHLSGGWQWDAARKADYANSMAADYHLIAVDKTANRAKGARGPEQWQPPDDSYHCQYARDWVAVKAAWDLSATPSEWEALKTMLAQCARQVLIAEDGSSVGLDSEVARLREALGTSEAEDGGAAVLVATQQPDSSPTESNPQTSPSGLLIITEFMPDPAAVRDSAGEWFEVYNPSTDQPVDLNGWTIRDGGKDNHRVAPGIEVSPQGFAVLGRNRDETTNGEISTIYEYHGFNLTNEEDAIELVDATGQVVDRVAYDADLVFPGASTSLDPAALDSTANDHPVNWCRSSSAMPNGDYGTPGEANDGC